MELLVTGCPKYSCGMLREIYVVEFFDPNYTLRSDFVYMAPPFLAYYGVITQNQSLVVESYNQIKLYRKYLRDPNANNLWKHIVMGTGTDSGHWSTG
jgi:rhamnogalacturonyl hydrolase YesR